MLLYLGVRLFVFLNSEKIYLFIPDFSYISIVFSYLVAFQVTKTSQVTGIQHKASLIQNDKKYIHTQHTIVSLWDRQTSQSL